MTSTRVHRVLDQVGVIAFPGVFDTLSARLGYQLILYPLAGLFAAAQAMQHVYQKLRRDSTTRGEELRLMGFDEFNRLIGVEEKYALAERFGAT
jgi:2-methylisocitrate lyase-like PEP mutase family enzyme